MHINKTITIWNKTAQISREYASKTLVMITRVKKPLNSHLFLQDFVFNPQDNFNSNLTTK